MTRDDWNRRWSEDRDWPSAPHPALPDLLAGLPPGQALDAGCGSGRHAIWLASQGWQVTAVDFAEQAIERAQRLAPPAAAGIDWLVADLAHWSPPERSVDLVLVAFLHTDRNSRAQWMQGLREAVRPGGRLIYVGHDLTNLSHGHGGPQQPEVLPSAREVAQALPGFELQRCNVLERRVGDDPGHGGPPSGLALDAVVEAVRLI